MAGSIHLPDEVIEVILSNCPAKSVVRFNSVSKSWRSIISDPRFSRIHRIQRSILPENHNRFLIWESSRERAACDVYLIKLEEDAKFRRESVLPYQSATHFFPLCSCNGLILFYSFTQNHHYTLWNPSIRKRTTIRDHDGVRRISQARPYLHHLYHDPIAEDHKLVFVYEKYYTTYSCKNGNWDAVKDLPCDSRHLRHGAAADGCFYMLSSGGKVTCFDVRDGKLRKFRQPHGVKLATELRAVSGRVCLYGLSEDLRRLELWVMDKSGSFEKRWRKLIGMEKGETNMSVFRPEYFCNEDDVGLRVRVGPGMDWKHFIYKHREKRFQELEFSLQRVYPFYPYFENLFTPRSNI